MASLLLDYVYCCYYQLCSSRSCLLQVRWPSSWLRCCVGFITSTPAASHTWSPPLPYTQTRRRARNSSLLPLLEPTCSHTSLAPSLPSSRPHICCLCRYPFFDTSFTSWQSSRHGSSLPTSSLSSSLSSFCQDVKLQNVLVSKEGIPQLADFGVSRHLGPPLPPRPRLHAHNT